MKTKNSSGNKRQYIRFKRKNKKMTETEKKICYFANYQNPSNIYKKLCEKKIKEIKIKYIQLKKC